MFCPMSSSHTPYHTSPTFKSRRSFTLIELLVVIAIVGVLAAFAIAALNGTIIKGRDTRRMSDIKQITNALELAYAFNDSYPIPDGNTTVCLSDCTSSNWCANLITQMSSIPNDPLPNQQCYLYNSDGKDFRVAAKFEASSNDTIAQNDGGLYSQYFEGQSTPGLIYFIGQKYASAAGGNWSSDSGTWVTASGGSIVIAHPGAGDTAILDANSGNVTVDVDSAAATLDLTGYKNTLAIGTKNLIISGNSTITSSGGTATVTIGASAGTGWATTNLTIGASGVVTCSGNSKINISGSSDISAGTFTRSTSTVTFSATTSGKTVKSGSNSYWNVTWNGSGGEWTLQDNFGHSSVLAMTLGTLIFNGKTYSYGVESTITVGSGFTLNIGTGVFDGNAWTSMVIPSGATVTVTSGTLGRLLDLAVSGTGVLTVGTGTIRPCRKLTISSSNFNAGTGTVYMGGSGLVRSDTLSTTQPFYNFTVDGTYTTMTVILGSDLTVQNNVLIKNSNAFLSPGSYTITVGGNFTNNATFTAGTGTVVFNDATKTSTISGTTTFYNFTSTTPNKAIRFTAGTTQTFTSFALTGTAGNLITIDTNTGASTFNLSDSTGTNQIYYTSVTRSVAGGGAIWNALVSDGNVNGGGNSGWAF